MSELTFDQALRLFVVVLRVILLMAGLGRMSADPEIDMEDPEGTVYSIIDYVLGLGGGTATAISGLILIVLGIYPKALSIVFKGF